MRAAVEKLLNPSEEDKVLMDVIVEEAIDRFLDECRTRGRLRQ